MKPYAMLVALALAFSGWAQDAPVSTSDAGLVTIASRGKDVREVLHDLFTQAKKNYVLDGAPRSNLFLVLNGVDFEETLAIVCKSANLQFEKQNGIYFLSPIAKPTAVQVVDPAPRPVPIVEKPKGRLPETVLTKRFTTKFTKTDFRKVVAEIAKQTNVRIEVDGDVPTRLVDAFLLDTSLKYGLDLLTSALGLEYRFSEQQSLVIGRPASRVAAIQR